MTVRSYPSPEAFKQALEQRLRNATRTGAEMARLRQRLVFDRFLARVVAEFGDAVTLKGGLVLELRLERARTTKDVDLRLLGSPGQILERLRDAARRDLADYLAFEVGPDPEHPKIQTPGMVYEGLRFRGECLLAGKIYGLPFGIDLAFGDPIFGEPEFVLADDLLAFVGIDPPRLPLYPVETHVAEKLHAYTLPRDRPNTRVKDLPDLALLATAKPIDSRRLRSALEQTFDFRETHSLPRSLPAPDPNWRSPYEAIAREDELPWATIEDVTAAVRAFLDPVLAAETDRAWDPVEWAWRS